IGTGPFKFKLWEENIKLVLRKNDLYYEKDQQGNQLPYLEAVAVTFLPDKQSEFLQFVQGNLRRRSSRLESVSSRATSRFSSSRVRRSTRTSLPGVASSVSRSHLQAPGGHSWRMGNGTFISPATVSHAATYLAYTRSR